MGLVLAHPALLRTVDTGLLPSSTNAGCPACHLSAPCFFFFFFKQNAVDWVPMLLVASRSLPLASAGTRHRHTVCPWQRHGMAQCFPLGLMCTRHGRGACPWHQWGTRHGRVLAPVFTGHKARLGACPPALMGTRHGRVLAPGISGPKARRHA